MTPAPQLPISSEYSKAGNNIARIDTFNGGPTDYSVTYIGGNRYGKTALAQSIIDTHYKHGLGLVSPATATNT